MIKNFCKNFNESKQQLLGLICKTQRQSELLYEKLKAHNVHLLTPESTTFINGIIITTTHLRKGLDFDEVVVPFVSADNYKTDIDRRMLYIACTRAMHRLTLTYTGVVTACLRP